MCDVAIKMVPPAEETLGGFAMPRRPRRACWTDAACYHVMNRGQNRATIFADDNDRQYFLALLARYSQRFDVRLYHFCLLGEEWGQFSELLDIGDVAIKMVPPAEETLGGF